jgi:hydrogenase maturation factor
VPEFSKSGAEVRLPEIGKISPEVFETLIRPRLGKVRADVLVPPQSGVDIGVVDIGGGRVMAMSTDPVFLVPEYGWERAAWFAIHILLSDVCTSGLAPTHLTIDLNLPPQMDADALDIVWKTIHRECEALNVAVVAGHTARYHGCDYPMVGGATVLAIGAKDRYITPQMARPGDGVLVTKGPAIEAAGLFAVTFPRRVIQAYGEDFAQNAEELFWQMSVVQDALIAASVGVRDAGVTAMHDATECGLWGGLVEVAQASDVGMAIDKEAIPLREDVAKLCALFGIDPFPSISEGTLILTCCSHKIGSVLSAFQAAGIVAAHIGEVVPASEGVRLCENGAWRVLEHPRVDPFWNAFARAFELASASS